MRSGSNEATPHRTRFLSRKSYISYHTDLVKYYWSGDNKDLEAHETKRVRAAGAHSPRPREGGGLRHRHRDGRGAGSSREVPRAAPDGAQARAAREEPEGAAWRIPAGPPGREDLARRGDPAPGRGPRADRVGQHVLLRADARREGEAAPPRVQGNPRRDLGPAGEDDAGGRALTERTTALKRIVVRAPPSRGLPRGLSSGGARRRRGRRAPRPRCAPTPFPFSVNLR